MSARFVVRERGAWWLATVPGEAPSRADLTAVLTAIEAAVDPVDGLDPVGPVVPPVPRPPRAPLPPLAATDLVAPVWSWVGRIRAGGVEVEGGDGHVRRLDGDALRLLDALDGAMTVGEVVALSAVTAGPQRLADLVDARRVKRLRSLDEYRPPPPRQDIDVTEVPAPALELHLARADRAAPSAPADRRVPVFAVWQEQVGPALSLGMLTASARSWRDGALGDHYEIRRPERPGECLAELVRRPGPAVLLCSNYLWSIDHNLELARRAKALCPELVVIHGGPSTPKYEGDAARFLAEHGDVADVLVRGEGEVVLCRLLDALAHSLPALDPAGLRSVPGLTFVDPTDGRVVRTGEPERVADLDALPSPYLTGEFDHIGADAWPFAVSIETNRGCPYGCTFCDWGSATLSRIRKFSVERVLAELEWVADRGIPGVQLCDANFGIIARDVEIAEGLADLRRRRGTPTGLGFTPPKNTTRHISRILDEVMGAGYLVSTAISLQTTDEATLAAVDRSNIATDSYLALAADLRRRGHPLMGDLLLGLPGQTYDAYKADLQFFVDHQIMARTWALKVLPNAPMNEPGYRERFRIRIDERGVVASTAQMSEADVDRAVALRRAEILGNRLGLLRHVGRFLQWDHGVAVTELLERVLAVVGADPDRYPLLAWAFTHFDLFPTLPMGRRRFYDEVGRFVVAEHGLDPSDPALATVLAVQVALAPSPERAFPDTVALAHDYVAYHRDATAGLEADGRASVPPRPLRAYAPGSLTVAGDPLGLCDTGLHFAGDSRDLRFEGDFAIGQNAANELDSPLLVRLPVFSGRVLPEDLAGALAG